MAVMEKLKIFVVQEPVVAASCLIAGFGEFSSSLSFNLFNHPFHYLLCLTPIFTLFLFDYPIPRFFSVWLSIM